jgi:hypothetical protein
VSQITIFPSIDAVAAKSNRSMTAIFVTTCTQSTSERKLKKLVDVSYLSFKTMFVKR